MTSPATTTDAEPADARTTGPVSTRPDGPADTQPDAPTTPGAYAPFAYLTAPNASLYRRIMRALMAQKERFTVHVRPEQVHAALRSDGGEPVTEEAVADALERLAQPAWGNLLAFPDSSRVTALEDFYRRRLLFQLSREGEAAERSLAQYDAALGTRGALQAVALEDIVVLLTHLRDTALEHTGSPAGAETGAVARADTVIGTVIGTGVDAASTHQAMRSLRDRFTELAENAVAFMGSIQRTIDLHDADVEAFLAYKEQLIEYLERFIDDLVTRGARIAALLGEISDDNVVFLTAVAAGREAQDAAPGEAERAATVAQETWLRQWAGLADWFVSSPDRESEAKLLRSRARAAIPALLAVVRALHDRAGGRTDRTQDFLTLARWFADLPDDGARHRLWRSAFGLSSARHLTVTAETVDAWDEAGLGNSTPWSDAPPLEISPQLRRTGSYERRGKANRVQDRSQAKALLVERARQETEQTAAARRRILTAGPRPLSAFDDLDPEAFRLFLSLLGDGLAAMGPEATTAQIHTSDGELTVTLSRVPGAGVAVLRTPDGELSGPDHLVDIASSVDEPAPTGDRPAPAHEPGPHGSDGAAERELLPALVAPAIAAEVSA